MPFEPMKWEKKQLQLNNFCLEVKERKILGKILRQFLHVYDYFGFTDQNIRPDL